MDDMKHKVKGFMKKVNNPFSSSSSGKFKGQGRVLGSASSSSEPINPVYYRPSTAATPRPNPSPPRPSNDSCEAAQPRKPDVLDRPKPESPKNQETKSANGFDPFDSLITSGKRSQNDYSLNLVECPICNRHFSSEEEVSEHVDHCTVNDSIENRDETGGLKLSIGDSEERSQLEELVRMYLSAKPTESSVEILIKLLRNIAREPDNVKFRRIRMANPKIKEAVGEVAGGVQLLESVGFELREESGEMWMVIEVPGKEGLGLISKAVALLEPKKIGVEEGKKIEDVASSKVANGVVEPTKIDRQIRVYFSVPESVAGRIDLPDTFYNLSAQEVKREAEMRRKKIEESQLLIPRSYKEKQAKAARKRYNKTVIRVQFPDGIVLQGIFAPWELTGSLYEFVRSALKEPSLEFELLNPVGVKRRLIPHSPAPGEGASTLEDEDLVPSALIKFRPIETDSAVFTGLASELLEISEPLQ